MSRDGVALRVEKHTDAVIIKQNGFSQIINKRLETDRAYLVKIALHNIRISSYNVRQRTGTNRAARPRARPGRLHQNVDGILESHKELMRNLLEWLEDQKQVPREVYDVLGVKPPDSDSESDSDHGTYSSSSEDYF